MVLLHTGRGSGSDTEQRGGGGGGGREEDIGRKRLGKYDVGRTLGEGNFGKVKYARNVESGQPFAIKILEKNRINDLNITDQVHFSSSSSFFFFFSLKIYIHFSIL